MLKRVQLVQYLGLLSIGVVANIVGPALPAMQRQFGMTLGQGGLVLAGQSIGLVLTVAVGGYLADRFGKRLYLLAGGCLITAGMAATLLARSFEAVFACMILAGTGFGAYEAGINALCADTNASDQGRAMNMAHMFFGLGAIAGPVLTTASLRFFHAWQPVFAFAALLPVVVSFLLLDSRGMHFAGTAGGRVQKAPYASPFLWLSALSILLYVGVEVSVAGWLPTFWRKLPGSGFIAAPLTATLFWLTLAIGRLVAGRVADRLGFGRYLALTAGAAALTALLWWAFGTPIATLAAALLMGFFLAGVYPTVTVAATTRYPGSTGQVAGLLALFAGLGGALIPSGIGQVATKIGIKRLPLFIAVVAVLLAANSLVSLAADRRRSRIKESAKA